MILTNLFGKMKIRIYLIKKTVIISYRGTGVSSNKNNFSFKGNWKRDKILDIKIAKGNLKKIKRIE